MVVLLALVVAGCSTIPGSPRPTDVVVREVAPSFVHGTDGGSADTLAATVVTDVRDYWSAEFPRHFDRPWRPLDGGFFSVDTSAPDDEPPPCTAEVSDIEGNAFYCATVDAIAWDRAALLPVLREHYGKVAVAVVLAHEIGHAAQQRAGTDSGSPARSEAVADCYAGSYTRWVVDGHSKHLRLEEGQLDGALRALINFRGFASSGRNDVDAHGSALDRVSAFQHGYRHGPPHCTGKIVENRQRPISSPDAEQSNQPVEQVLRSGAALRAYFAELAPAGRWKAPEVHRFGATSECARRRAAVIHCAPSNTVLVDRDDLSELNHTIGDQASVTLLAAGYARAALPALGLPTTGPAADRSTACLVGAYTGALVEPGSERVVPPTGPLTVSGLDEAVTAVLAIERARDSDALTGFDRIAAFRTGMRDGAQACGS